MTFLRVLACGAFGGMCPSIAKLASVYSTNPDAAMPALGAYIAMALFAFLGAGIALGFGATEVKAAIIAGIAAPGIVTNVVAGAAERSAGLGEQQALVSFIAPAYAQAAELTPTLIQDTERVLTVFPQVLGGQIGPDGLDFRFQTDSGMTLPGATLYSTKTSDLQIVVPEGATTLVIGSATFALPQTAEAAEVVINTAPTIGGDLLWALGGTRNYAVGEVSVTFSQ